jgi:hypothetical protein
VRPDAATGEHVLRITAGNERRVAWWTVRALDGATWRTWVLPGSQRRLVIAPAGAARPARIVVTAVDRYGTESPAAEPR